MGKLKQNEQGFSVVEIVLVVVIIALIGTVGWLVYKNHHKTTTAADITTTSSTKPASTTSTKTTTPATVQPVNPYAGWTSYTTSYYKVSLKYPASWKLDTSASTPYSDGNADDAVNLTAPDGFFMNVDYGNDGACSGEYNTILFNQPVTVNGTSGYLDYINAQEGTPASDVNGFFLSPKSTTGGGEQIDYGSNRLCINGQTKNYESVSQAQTDPDYSDALLVAKSVTFSN